MTTKLTKEADNKSIKVIDKVLINKLDNKSINKPDNKSINKPDNKSINGKDNKSINESDNKSINKTVNSNTTSWYDTDKFNEILATIDKNNFNHKNKTGKLKFNDINNLINGIKGNTISEADTKKKINELNEIKKVETNGKIVIENQKKLLSLFDDLKIIFNLNVNESVNDLDDYWDIKYYEDNKEINLRLFKLKLAHVLDHVNDNLCKEIFGFTSEELADKLINITSKEDNQMIIDHIEIKKGKIFEQEYSKFIIYPAYTRNDLVDTVKVILEFNKTTQPYLT